MPEEDPGHIEHSRRADLGITSRVERPLKVVFLGAGSGFLQSLFPDVMSIPGAERGHMALVDVDEERLELAEQFCRKVLGKMGSRWTLSATTEHKEVLAGRDQGDDEGAVRGGEGVPSGLLRLLRR